MTFKAVTGKAVAVGLACFALALTSASAEESDGLVLPPGFHASVVAEGLGPVRHMAIRGNGDIYISTPNVKGAPPAGILALRLGPDHKVAETQHFGTVSGGTGIRFYRGALYAASAGTVYRYTFSGDALVPAAEPQAIVDGMPTTGPATHSLAFDGQGNLYVSVDGSGNICVAPEAPKVGLKPCPGLVGRSGVWRFDAQKVGQKFPGDGEQIATGIRNMGAMDWSAQGGALYGITHGRDMTHQTFPDLVSQADDDAIADEMHRIVKGANLGWPYTYYDGVRNIRLAGPEYGGDNKTAVESGYDKPVLAFAPKRRAPLDLVFYTGTQFPANYRGGAFIAFHGTNGPQIPGGHGGYEVTFVPMDRAGKLGTPVDFAEGFAGPTAEDKYTGHATYRPVSLAVGPDGALYVLDSNKGRLWRVVYSGH